MQQWLLPTVSEILALSEQETGVDTLDAPPIFTLDLGEETLDAGPVSPSQTAASVAHQAKAEQEWQGAMAALHQLLQTHLSNPADLQGLVISGPACVLDQSNLAATLSTWVLSPLHAHPGLQLPPALEQPTPFSSIPSVSLLTLLPGDPLGREAFCLVLTPKLSVVLALGTDRSQTPQFRFSFDPQVVHQVWRSLQPRLSLTNPEQLKTLDVLYEQFPPVAPPYQLVMQFSRWLLHHLPFPEALDRAHRIDLKSKRSHDAENPPVSAPPAATEPLIPVTEPTPEAADVELLQAIAHEVRTPLTTIRTLTRLLLKRQDLADNVIKRLEMIDRECSEQIDRFGLIFRAVELETAASKAPAMPLTQTSLDQVLQQSIPRWQKQASQRSLSLDVVLPQKMPTVVSDPHMLDQMLTSLIENFTRRLSAGSHIQLQVRLAGHQLKLQFQSRPPSAEGKPDSTATLHPPLRSLGQLLMFQPETGNLSLNLNVTKNLFQALGGKLIVRQRPKQGEILTIFLPLENKGSETPSI